MSSELLMLLKHEARTHKLCGANGLGKLFESAVERITELEKALRDLLAATDEVYSNSSTLGHAEDAAAEALKEQGE